MHIAVVDDDRGVRESLAFMLQVAGHEVSGYASGYELLGQCPLQQVAALMLDQHMPDMTGLEVAARLRAENWRFPILLITAGPSPAIAARAAELGLDSVLPKPFVETDIMAFIQRVDDLGRPPSD
jgi:FixJ family two-component response regulator